MSINSHNDNFGLDLSTVFAGGRLCLDFVNTWCMRRDVELEFLNGSAELKRWLCQADGFHGTHLGDGPAWSDEDGHRRLEEALELRAALRELALSVIEKRVASADALDTVNAVLRAHPTYGQIAIGDAGFREAEAGAREDWLATIARDAVNLLCHGDLSLLRQCEHPTCVRVFYDTTKNHRRRWCAEKCGSHSKAAAYYRRKVAKTAGR
ncbi:MAG TPA: ABATE domain-containing protein [Capsulimonadaceae bacterium]|jgi:predicted RNA-binding Zn ribbon-like protein